jgi:hypothetical protein
MFLSIRNQISEEIKLLDRITVEHNQSEFFFVLSSSTAPSERAYIKYVLAPQTDYHPTDYSLYILKSHILNRENDIFQVYEREYNIRIGWIFHIQALLSNEHNYANNQHFLKYSYVAFFKLLQNVEQYETYKPNLNSTSNYELTDFYGDEIIILILCNSKLQIVDSFNIENYLTSLYSYGYYYCQPIDIVKNIHSRAAFTQPGQTKISIKRISKKLQEEVYLSRLFKILLKTEEHPLVRFYLLYQVIELIIERIFDKKFLDTINDFNHNQNKNIFELKEKINSISNEKERISQLIDSVEPYLNSDSKTNLLFFCNDLLSSFNSEHKDSLARSLYAARSFIVHKFRKLPEVDVPKIDNINKEFETMLIDILLNYQE